MATEILSSISIIATVIVGFILHKQIKAQATLIEQYKGFIEAMDPKKIITLHEREIEKLQKVTSYDIEESRLQLFELANYVDQMFNFMDQLTKTLMRTYKDKDPFDRNKEILKDMPRCKKLLDDVHAINQAKKQGGQLPSSNA